MEGNSIVLCLLVAGLLGPTVGVLVVGLLGPDFLLRYSSTPSGPESAKTSAARHAR
jgi:hypothetical protein